MKATHYSSQQRTVLDSSFYGTGYAGAERQRLAGADERIRNRIHFYLEGSTIESGVGGFKHEVDLSPYSLIDLSVFKPTRPVKGLNDLELNVLEAGYAGYTVDRPPLKVAVLLGKRTIRVQS